MIGWILGLLGFATYPRREYDAYAILGDPARPPIWHWNCWTSDVAPWLDPLFAAARGKPHVRSMQYTGSTPKSRNFLRFGRLGWDRRSHEKWVHGSPQNRSESGDWTMFESEVCAPGKRRCERDDSPPDVYFAFANKNLQALINPVVILALAADLPESSLQQGRRAALALADVTGAPVAAYQRRPWGFKDGKILVAYTNVIDELTGRCLLKRGWYARSSVTFDILDGDWTDARAGQAT